MKYDRLLINIILCILIIPVGLTFTVNAFLLENPPVNQALAPKPPLNLPTIHSFPEKYEAYFNDHLPLRGDFVKLNSWLNIRLFNTTDSDQVIIGQNNWLFYKSVPDGDPLACYQGTNLLTDDELQRVAEQVQWANDYCKSKGAQLVILIAPNKEVVYAQNMPPSIPVISAYRRADQIYDYVNAHTDVPLLYPKDELLEVSADFQTYYAYDTHWNGVGSFIGAQQVFAALGLERESLDGKRAEYNDQPARHDLADMINMTDSYTFDRNMRVYPYKENVRVDRVTMSQNEWQSTYRSTALDTRKVLLLGDSFSYLDWNGMVMYVGKMFSDVTFRHFMMKGAQSYINYKKPDIVILEVVERYAHNLLDLENLFK